MIRFTKNLVNQGFTMVELLVTITIAAVLLSVAAPNFSDAMRNSQQIIVINDLIGSLRLARSEAIKRSTRTAVCARSNDTLCGTDWNNGFITFIDNMETPGAIDAGEEILRIGSAIETGWIMNRARLVNTSESPIERPFIRFGPRGSSNWRGSGYFAVCDNRGQEYAKAVNVSLSGDPRRARHDNRGDLINSFGGPTVCGNSSP